MAEGYLFDLPLGYFQNACTTDGVFDPEKAAALGYSEAQFPAIQEVLGEPIVAPTVESAPAVESEDDDISG